MIKTAFAIIIASLITPYNKTGQPEHIIDAYAETHGTTVIIDTRTICRKRFAKKGKRSIEEYSVEIYDRYIHFNFKQKGNNHPVRICLLFIVPLLAFFENIFRW